MKDDMVKGGHLLRCVDMVLWERSKRSAETGRNRSQIYPKTGQRPIVEEFDYIHDKVTIFNNGELLSN